MRTIRAIRIACELAAYLGEARGCLGPRFFAITNDPVVLKYGQHSLTQHSVLLDTNLRVHALECIRDPLGGVDRAMNVEWE